MATEDCKDLLSSGNQSENVENDLYNDVNIMATSFTSEQNEEAFLIALEDKNAEEVKANAVLKMAAEVSMKLVDGHDNTDELGDNDVENDKKVEAVNSSSNKETKKILRKRKKNAEDISGNTLSSPSKTPKKKTSNVSAIRIKGLSPCDKSTEGNAEKEVETDGQPESIGKADDEVEKVDDKDVKVGEKVKGAVSKAVRIAKKKIDAKPKAGSSNAEPAPTKSSNVAVVEASSSMKENAKPNVKSDENPASATKSAVPTIEEKDAEGTKDKPTSTKKHLTGDDSAEKQLKKVDGMGLIFMCNAKTKKDCFKYNVFGLPESKKALVAKIYKGMRLFLFDFDLKLLYGIFKAASPGGYNIEPKAFGSKFPSQVRFTVLRDSLPLPEEKFKSAIKDNYTTRNKFDCQLSPVQVRKLCKLFQSATGREAVMPSSRAREPKRRHVRREIYPSPPPLTRHYPSPPPRRRYPSPPPRALPPVPLPPSYTYERPGDDYYYRSDHRRVLDLEMRPRNLPIDYSYNLYREPVLYREPAYPPSLPVAYAARPQEPRSPPRYLY
ncbi:uncharacterized protein LOC110031511 [Phalaenopsis equestris]|uniref:uncharacterized protein LOC110031511 n=1 Tax=Phalaenopsis equestris TaxID=78828 RepID=UPI0009E45801|nr:uncharacterized protein LOC110031511 [Phalaenopsis equestris]XP_020590407.1 uncharacterized protein LOC110031511 [Phalaenopsis equestris]